MYCSWRFALVTWLRFDSPPLQYNIRARLQLSVHNLLPDGRLLRTAKFNRNQTFAEGGGSGGAIQIFSFDGELEWQYELSDTEKCLHHDIEMLPNGNILVIAWERLSQSETVALGRNSENVTESGLWSEIIFEIEPQGISGGTIVWEWHLYNHFVQDIDSELDNYGDVALNPQLIDLNYSTGSGTDLFHINAIEYIEEFDLILLSVRNYSELWILDHSTTTIEATSHLGGTRNKGGDLLYRWGNPATYKSGTTNDQLSFGQHDATWIEGQSSNGGNILFFNNGDPKSRRYSTADEIILPHDGNGNFNLQPNTINGPTYITWSFGNNDLFSEAISGAQKLENGNTLICEGQTGVFWEVTPEKEIVWKFTLPLEKNSTFRVYRYGKDYAAFQGKTLDRLSIEFE